MAEFSIYIFFIALFTAIGLQVYSIVKIEEVYQKTKGVIRFRHDLLAVRDVINLNMGFAVLYLIMFGLFFIFIVIIFINGMVLRAIIMLFLFGVITLPVGLLGKHYEKKIKSMEVQSNDPEIANTFRRYLIQWKEPRLKLQD